MTDTEKADDIPGPVTHEIVVSEPPYVFIKWNAPRSPNGLIILYEVFYKKVGDPEVSINHCQTFREYRKSQRKRGLWFFFLKLKQTEVREGKSQQK